MPRSRRGAACGTAQWRPRACPRARHGPGCRTAACTGLGGGPGSSLFAGKGAGGGARGRTFPSVNGARRPGCCCCRPPTLPSDPGQPRSEPRPALAVARPGRPGTPRKSFPCLGQGRDRRATKSSRRWAKTGTPRAKYARRPEARLSDPRLRRREVRSDASPRRAGGSARRTGVYECQRPVQGRASRVRTWAGSAAARTALTPREPLPHLRTASRRPDSHRVAPVGAGLLEPSHGTGFWAAWTARGLARFRGEANGNFGKRRGRPGLEHL